MAQNNVLRWQDGRGWLILSGGGENLSDVRALALGRAAADGGVAYITLGSQSGLGERALADMEDLGAPPGYLVDVLSEDDETVTDMLSEAGIVVIEGGAELDDLRSSLIGAAIGGIQTAFQNGAVVLAEGSGASVFGAWVLLDSDELTAGFEWLDNGLIIPGITSIADSSLAQDVLLRQPGSIAVGIGEGSALALGPDGEVEPWGLRQVTVALGKEYGL
ncbi:MAG: hypothetical protein ABI690_17745 [Chloroflexota bacterium]